ncbi:hypothetical protein ACFQ1S_29505, partial [Kibdelosporangium lantanae]
MDGDRLGVAAANGDRQKTAKALATYGSENDGVAHAIERIARPAGSTGGGMLYDWPVELSSVKSTYSSLVTGDPLSAVNAKRRARDTKAALEAAKAAMTRIGALIASDARQAGQVHRRERARPDARRPPGAQPAA